MQNRIEELRKANGLTLQALASAVGTSHQQIMRLERGERKLTQQWMEKISAVLGVSAAELIAAPGGIKDAEAVRPRKKPEKQSGILEIDVRGGMGGGGVYFAERNHTDEFGNTTATDIVRDLWDLPTNYIRYELRVSPENAKIIEVKGDSMAPTLMSGDRVMIDTSDTSPTPPGLFAVWDGTGVVVKRVEPVHRSDPPAIRLISDNEKHQPYECTTEEARIIGRVIWFARRI